jgi:hypothetical protein
LASTTYQRIRLDLQSPWNLGTETTENWSLFFHLSGNTALTQGDAELTALDLWAPVRMLTRTTTSLIQYSYYAMGSRAATWFKTYPPGTHPGDESGYTGTTNLPQQLEVCVVARCPIGKNALGRPNYLRKHIHCCLGSGDGNSIGANSGATTILNKWNTGSGPHLLVPVSPGSGVQGGPWTLETHLFTRQLRKGQKRKVQTDIRYVPVPLP